MPSLSSEFIQMYTPAFLLAEAFRYDGFSVIKYNPEKVSGNHLPDDVLSISISRLIKKFVFLLDNLRSMFYKRQKWS